MPEISIIVPVYKVEKYLRHCVDSILAQTFTDFELLLIDDGSPDNSGAICDEYAEKDNRVRVFHKENGGVSSARNLGLDNAQGKYVMFCDSDDFVRKDWCQKMRNLMVDTRVSIGFCGYQSVDIRTGLRGDIQKYSTEEVEYLNRTCFWDIYLKNLLNMPWNKIFRAEIISNSHLSYDESIHYNEDLLFVLDYIKKSSGLFGIVNLPLNYYVQGIDGSLTRRYVPDLWNIKKRVFKEMDAVLYKCNIFLEDIQNAYYEKWIFAIVSSLNNNAKVSGFRNKLNTYKENRQILKSEECRIAFENGSFDEYNHIYAEILKKRNYFLILIWNMLYKIYSFCNEYYRDAVNERKKRN